MLKSKKTVVIEEMSQIYLDYSCFVIAKYQGLSVAQITSLRKSLRKDGVNFKVVKNSLSKIAASKSDKQGFDNIFSGPVGIAYANDPVSIAKHLVEFAKSNVKLQIVGGIIDNKLYNDSQILELSKLSSLEEIRARIAGALSGVASRLIRTIQSPAGNVARVIGAYAAKNKE